MIANLNEVEKLNKLLVFYEGENQRLKLEVESNISVISSHVERINEQEKVTPTLYQSELHRHQHILIFYRNFQKGSTIASEENTQRRGVYQI